MPNPFLPQKLKYEPEVCDISSDIVTLEVQDVVRKVTDDKTKTEDFVIEKVVKETSRINLKDYIQSFADDVGIENILKKVALTGDVSLLNQVNRQSLPVDENGYEVLQDYTGVPSDPFEAKKVVDSAYAAFDKLPKELVGSRSFQEFCESATADEIATYVKAVIVAQNVSSEGGDK